MNDKRTIERFMAKVKKTRKCWLWTGSKTRSHSSFYGGFFYGKKTKTAHSVSYALFNGSLNPDLVVHHTCENTLCVNPKHLKQITNRENIILGRSPVGVNIRKTHCPSGHPYRGKNLIIKMVDGYPNRFCKICKIKRDEVERWKYAQSVKKH